MEDTRKQTYIVYDTMKILGAGRNSAHNLTTERELSAIKVGRTLCISKSSSDDWLNKQKGE